MEHTVRASLILFCILILGVALTAGCGNDEDQTSPFVDTVPPSIPLDVTASPSEDGGVQLDWAANTIDPDLAGYVVYRSTSPQRGFQPITDRPVPTNVYVDRQARAGQNYWYSVSARDVHLNESSRSSSSPTSP